MDPNSGILLAASVVRGMVALTYKDETGKQMRQVFGKGRYSRRNF